MCKECALNKFNEEGEKIQQRKYNEDKSSMCMVDTETDEKQRNKN